ncbi:MAG: PSD1 and planctomycete cytochrome C domain-containing protein [Gemmataceae bacterium]|nr:PSD1 and planctomycete cytochrome C domain-containing protein [Gemmataceae bacterium]
MTRPAAVLALLAAAAPGPAADAVDYARSVAPLLTARCGKCHGPEKQRGGLRLDDRAAAFAGGDSGDPTVTPNDPDGSALIQRLVTADPALRMPPKADPLPKEEIDLLRRWVAEGASWPEGKAAAPRAGEMTVTDVDRDHWAFRPLRPVPTPAVKDAAWARTPIDRFVLAALETKGLAPTAEADRRTLIRRLTFDLHGLPPTPEEVAAFLADDSPDAYEKVVDRLLASPGYGERWARHWLDLARYADTAGYELDPERPHAWRYRDWVIRALNADLPYNTFARWQVAGDEYEPGNPDALAATGFLAVGPRLDADTKLEEEQRRYRYDELDDILNTTGQAFLGLTVGCCRCHDHKFDPLPTRDYYRFLAAFAGTKRAEPEVALPDGAKGKLHAVVDAAPEPGPNWVLARGDVMARKDDAPFGVFRVLLRDGATEADYLAKARAAAPDAKSTLRRRALAEWLTDPDRGAGGLLARVIANRLGQHHLGQPFVGTPSDFGTQGDRPTHPELLDWLAARLIAEGWSLKKLHRLVVTSATYRQGTAFDPAKAAVDPDNRLLWRRRPVRLEAEALRDAMLAVSGSLNPAMYGPGVKPPIPAELMVVKNDKSPYPADAKDEPATRRRSVYLYGKRTIRFPLVELFDGADPNASCGRRAATTVAPQALAVLNDPLVRARAKDFADRLLKDAADDGDVVRRAYELALSRPPRDAEAAAGVAFLAARTKARAGRDEPDPRRRAAADFAQVVFGLNEFLYVD